MAEELMLATDGNHHRQAVVAIHADVLIRLLLGGTKRLVVQPQLPAGVVVRQCRYNGWQNRFELLLEHDSFPLVYAGAEPPLLDVRVRIEEA